MKYSEYLQRVKHYLRTPDNADLDPDDRDEPLGAESCICMANGQAYSRLLLLNVGPPMRKGYQAHKRRLDECIEDLLADLRRESGSKFDTYPSTLGMCLGMDRYEWNDGPWRQKVRHELLDKWIAEAEAKEQTEE